MFTVDVEVKQLRGQVGHGWHVRQYTPDGDEANKSDTLTLCEHTRSDSRSPVTDTITDCPNACEQ